jgi:3-methyladenine DNA glycosylase AlkD
VTIGLILCLLKSFNESIHTESSWKVCDIAVGYLSDGAALWAGEGCIEPLLSQPSEALHAVDMITREFLWFFENFQAEGTGHFSL